MTALITQGQWERILGAAKVATLCTTNPDEVVDETTAVADSDVVDEMLALASDYVQEFATAAGSVLTAEGLTPVMRRRVAMVAGHYAGSRGQRYRDDKGRAPYFVEYSTVTKELEEWGQRLRSLSNETPDTGPLVLSDDPRGW